MIALAGNLISCIFWGFVLAVLVTATVFMVCRAMSRQCASSPWTWGVLALLMLVSGAQTTMFVGAMKAKGYVDDVAQMVSTLLPDSETVASTADDVEDMRRQVADSYPMISPLLEKADLSDMLHKLNNGATVASLVTDEMGSMLNSYMLRRVGWTALFVVLALLAIYLLDRQFGYHADDTYDYTSAGSGGGGLQF